LVIGGSVGGLFAAHLLRQTGWDVAVFERAASDLGDRGTGIGTRPELFSVMRRIGLPVPSSIGVEVAGRVALGVDGQTIHELPTRAITSAWSRIWRPLRQAFPESCYLNGKTLVRFDLHDNGIDATFADGAQVTGDLLVAADGLHSSVRAQIFPDLIPSYAGYVAWRGVVTAGRLTSSLHDLLLHRMVFGCPDRELMLSIPMPATDLDGERACHFVWFRPATDKALADLCTDQSGRCHGLAIPPPLIRPELIEAVRRNATATLAPPLAALVDATPQIILQPIFDLSPRRIAFDRIALVGDAAFVARPHVATVVLKAAIDAENLADALAACVGDIAAGLERYNSDRHAYGSALVERGRHIGIDVVGSSADRPDRVETLLREYGAAGLVRDRPIEARGAIS
jgi:2-polyprenyl-6-methoxyphenol hydroxylase-like FAD-dependent oxidoreductase